MKSPKRLAIPATLAVVALAVGGAGCGNTVTPTDAAVDLNSINNGDVVRLDGYECIPYTMLPDGGGLIGGQCFTADGQPLIDCNLGYAGPDGSAVVLC